MPATLEGDLRHFLVSEIFQLLSLSGSTGRVWFERVGECVEIQLDQGRIARAASDRGSVKLGEVLVHAGLVDERDLDDVLSQEGDGAPLGERLAAEGLVSSEEAAWGLGEVVRRVLLGVLLWREGRFHFEPDPDLVFPSIAPAIDLERALLDGLSIADELRASA